MKFLCQSAEKKGVRRLESSTPILLFALITSALWLTGCQNAIPTVTRLTADVKVPSIEAKDPRNFSQLNAGSGKETLIGGYQAQVRISQPLAELKSTSTSGYKLDATVNLMR